MTNKQQAKSKGLLCDRPWVVLLTLSCIILQNGQAHFKNHAVITPQYCQSIIGHCSTFRTKGLKFKIAAKEGTSKDYPIPQKRLMRDKL